MSEKEIITFRGDKKTWDKWVLRLRKEKIQIWDKIKFFIQKDLSKK